MHLGARLTGSVGRGGTNRPIDVLLVQYLINQILGPLRYLPVDGVCGSLLILAIEEIERTMGRKLGASGVIHPDCPAFRHLVNAYRSRIDKDKIVEYARVHAQKGSLGQCAAYCRRALEAGGVNTRGHPVAAKDYGPLLLQNGATEVSPEGYVPIKADIVVFAGNDMHPYGHIAIYDDAGRQWISDFKQKRMSPYRSEAPPNVVYRFAQSSARER